MANKFDEANALTREPDEIRKGTRVQWTRADLTSDYPPSTYRLIFTARSPDGDDKISLTSAQGASGDHLFTVTSSESAAWRPAEFHYQVEIERISDNERVDGYSGTIRILADLDNNGSDPRSHAQKMLSQIEALLEGRALKDVSSYSINGRSLTKMTIDELIDWRGHYRSEVRQEKAKNDQKAGKKSNQTIGVRFT